MSSSMTTTARTQCPCPCTHSPLHACVQLCSLSGVCFIVCACADTTPSSTAIASTGSSHPRPTFYQRPSAPSPTRSPSPSSTRLASSSRCAAAPPPPTPPRWPSSPPPTSPAPPTTHASSRSLTWSCGASDSAPAYSLPSPRWPRSASSLPSTSTRRICPTSRRASRRSRPTRPYPSRTQPPVRANSTSRAPAPTHTRRLSG